ncbi:peptide-methionine (S)-S-oxide reductase [Chitinophaga costaii]|uniref:Peptide methionine sulfoxide reductase MsrA n=1 Tax=Chitinophaga costaii TaxID=1335309 RepID=A0A1C4E2Y0_9BACT|nr:peptide-methionine (S)-S-oxide reductase MsrA [Chitinophaga costaii]PUZ24401.1 peptide-methionine (S)-S-oxide reductase [Chitinophaga costaii]SCC37944.1 peptide-methionine (S)-S-oxide reductase [Chitinophaga costaii]
MLKQWIFTGLLGISLSACAQHGNDKVPKDMNNIPNNIKTETATFGGGCFWCTEAQLQQLQGVLKVESGFSGGTVPNPSYEAVCTGETGHAEVVQVTYDPSKLTYAELLQAFWTSHDPTQLNRQGNDVGTQYRSVIFYHNEEQHKEAEFYKKKLQESGAYTDPIVTEIAPFTKFYKAEDYHQNYYANNGSQPYCMFVIRPKLEKFKKVFKEHLKQQ